MTKTTPAVLALSLLSLVATPGAAALGGGPRVSDAKVTGMKPPGTRLQSRPTGGIKMPTTLNKATRTKLLKSMVPKSKQDALAELPQLLEMRLTPMHPLLDSGARIEAATGIDFQGATPEWPDGSYWMSGKVTEWYYPASEWREPSKLVVSVPTEVDKMYVVDCRALVWDYWGYDTGQYNSFGDGPVKLTLGKAPTQTVSSVDGHVLGVLQAKGTTSKITLEYSDPELISYHGLVFWGCDIGKV
jgi:hypothetical protein